MLRFIPNQLPLGPRGHSMCLKLDEVDICSDSPAPLIRRCCGSVNNWFSFTDVEDKGEIEMISNELGLTTKDLRFLVWGIIVGVDEPQVEDEDVSE
jgi:hypothetical protein